MDEAKPSRRIKRREDNSAPGVDELIAIGSRSELEALLRTLRRPALYDTIVVFVMRERQRQERSRTGNEEGRRLAFLDWNRR
jgi:hypothetical protein